MADDRKSQRAELEVQHKELLRREAAIQGELRASSVKLVMAQMAEEAANKAEYDRRRAVAQAEEDERIKSEMLKKHGSYEAAVVELYREVESYRLDR